VAWRLAHKDWVAGKGARNKRALKRLDQYGTKEKETKGNAPDSAGTAGPTTGTQQPMLLGGLVKGEPDLERKAVVLDVPRHAGGRVLLYSFNPVHRYLNHADHNYLYNAILNWNDFPDPEPEEHPGLARD
jgi:hypothetical protein